MGQYCAPPSRRVSVGTMSPRSCASRSSVMVFGAKFEVEWPTDPDRGRLIRSHFGARRKAFNWGLAQVNADLDARGADPSHGSVGWDLGSLRMAWNRAKGGVAPCWADNLKEAYS